LQPLNQCGELAGHKLAYARGDHLARRGRDSQTHLNSHPLPEQRVKASQPFLHFQGRPDGSFGIVLVSLRNAKNRKNCVADILFDFSAVALHPLSHFGKVGVKQCLPFFGIHTGQNVRVACEIGHEDGNELALRTGRGCQRHFPATL
jgi:hypothetical protein